MAISLRPRHDGGPTRPPRPRADCGSGSQPPRRRMSNYYESDDLKKFGDIGAQGAKAMADDFFRYYGNVTGTDSALSKREKALIALAVAHAMKCPYCIDAYSTQCLETGSN